MTTRIRSSVGRFALVASVLVLAAGPVGAWTGDAGATVRPLASNGSDAAKASQVNIRSSDLPKSADWSSTPAPPSPVSLGEKAVACMKSGGGPGAKVSPDPFGTVGKPSGDVTADVSSKVFGIKESVTGLPSASSEVVFVSTTKQALADLVAFGTSHVQSCVTTLMAAVTGLSAGGKVKATASTLTLPHLGNGGGGVHLRFVFTGGNIPAKLYEDLYYYVEGRAEVTLTFVNLTAPFSSSWASSIVKSVMARAKSVAG
jgi:hypothetical protein